MKQLISKSSKLYESIGMMHPDGTLMCMTSSKKANWYLKRGLADIIDDKMIKLKFVPNGYGNSNNQYYLEPKKNICVVCGDDENLTHHHVVPYQFRKLFPEELKSHDHHDVLLVCRKCHNQYEREADNLKNFVFKSIGYDIKEVNKIKRHNGKVRSSVDFLNNLKTQEKIDDIPISRLQFLQNISDKGYMKELPDWKELFINKYILTENINEFCSMWRKHFIETMRPEFLSMHFRIYHNRNG